MDWDVYWIAESEDVSNKILTYQLVLYAAVYLFAYYVYIISSSDVIYHD